MSANTTLLRAIRKVVTAHKQREGGGFIVRRPFPPTEHDPFLLLDHFGPVEYGPGEAVGAPDHPHRGFETVTYMLEGGMHHKDSQGNEGRLGAGWVQWMTAGSGVVHSEMPVEDILEKGGRMEGFQLWVNLPRKDKMIQPRYQDTPPERIPVAKSEDGKVTVKVIAGESLGTKAVIDTRTPIMYLDVVLQPGGELTQAVPADFDGFAYVYRGKGVMGADEKQGVEGQLLSMGPGNAFKIRAAEDEECRALIIAGVPLKEPVARYGPFVMNTREEIQQAFRDYQEGRLGEIAGAEERREATAAAQARQKSQGRWQKDEL